MLKRAAIIAACIIGIVVGYCLPHTPVLTDIKDGEDYIVATFLEDSKNAGANYIVKFNGDIAVEWYKLK